MSPAHRRLPAAKAAVFRHLLPVAMLLIAMPIFDNTKGADAAQPAGLTVENADTPLAYIAHNGKPLLAFGPHLEHGMNHCRARLYHGYYRKYSPFLKTEDGRYDLTQWDESFWRRFSEQYRQLQPHKMPLLGFDTDIWPWPTVPAL